MSRQDDLQKIRKLTIELNIARDEYYNGSKPSLTDKEYDEKFEELKSLEEKTGFFFSGSPTKTVGYQVSTKLPKIKHTYPLLSLDKTKDKHAAFTFSKDHEALLMYKLDGLTICLEYNNGKLITAATRGNGEEGSIITENAKTFMNIPLTIDYEGYLKITGEGIIHKNDFTYINSLINDEKDRYSTPRNLASGSVQQLDPNICKARRVHFYAFNVLEGLEDIRTISGRLQELAKNGFSVCNFLKFSTINTNFQEFSNDVENLVRAADKADVPIDGLVVMINDIQYGKSLGKTSHHYRNGIALKFKEEEEKSIIRDIEWQVGRTGKITPVAVFDKVNLDNTDVSKATLHNLSIISELGIRKESEVIIVKSNEIIPMIISSTGGKDYFDIPEKCPVCGQPTEKVSDGGSISLYCKNDNCAARNTRRISYFASKECMNIDGLSEKTVERFINAGILNNILDIYYLKNYHDVIVELDGMGEKSFEKLVKSIEKSKNVKLENFIAALGIQNVALSKAKILSKQFDGKWENFTDALENNFDLTVLDSFGIEINSCIYDFWNNQFLKTSMYKELASLMNFLLPNKNDKAILKDKVFVITGSLERFKNRKELQEKIEELGGKVVGSVSSNTSYLINNDIESNSSKNKKAKKLNIPIITESDFINKFIN